MKYSFFIGSILLLLLATISMKTNYEVKDEVGALLIDGASSNIRAMSLMVRSSSDTILKKHTDSVILSYLPDAYELRGTIRARSDFFTPYTKSNASVDTLIQKIIYYGNIK